MSANIAVLVSGGGTNLQALLDAEARGILHSGRIVLVVSSRPDAYALTRAKAAGVEVLTVTRADGEMRLIEALEARAIDLVVLAGFMRVLSAPFVSAFANSIVNIHPSLLPAFPGMRSIREAYDHGVRVTGVTVHLVDRQVDHGPILAQEPVRVHDGDTLGTLEERIHAAEHDLYWRTLQDLFAGVFKLDGRRRMVRDQAPSFAVRME